MYNLILRLSGDSKFSITLFISILLVKEGELRLNVPTNLTKPTKLGNCKVRLDDNSIIDLTSLDDAKNPRLFYSSLSVFIP